MRTRKLNNKMVFNMKKEIVLFFRKILFKYLKYTLHNYNQANKMLS